MAKNYKSERKILKESGAMKPGGSWPFKKLAEHSSKHKALEAKKGGHKQGEREARSKKAGHYVHGHKNFGDVYEA